MYKRQEQGSILDELEQHPISATVYTGAKEQSSYEGGEINVNNYYAYEKSDDALYNDGVDVTIVEKDKEMCIRDRSNIGLPTPTRPNRANRKNSRTTYKDRRIYGTNRKIGGTYYEKNCQLYC